MKLAMMTLTSNEIKNRIGHGNVFFIKDQDVKTKKNVE